MVRPVVTGITWMGSGIGAIEKTLIDLIQRTERDLVVLTYSVSGGASPLFDLMEDRLRKGVRVRFVTNRTEMHGRAGSSLHRLAGAFRDRFELYDYVADDGGLLHAKCLIADRARAFVGSANLSHNGLIANHELGVLIEGDDVEPISRATDQLLHSRSVARIA